jgi:hypothetical protein
MWKKWVEPPKSQYKAILRKLQNQKKAKFYADEDIEDGEVAILRECGVNITSARELRHRGTPDSFHAALAFKEKRFLLARNGRHYLNDPRGSKVRTPLGIGILEQVFGEHCIRVTLLSGEMQVPYERMTTFRLAEVRPL